MNKIHYVSRKLNYFLVLTFLSQFTVGGFSRTLSLELDACLAALEIL